MMRERVRIAIVGGGLMGRRHVDAISKIENVEAIAVADPDETTRSYAESHRLRWFCSLTDLFNECTPDGVILATPTSQHVVQGVECLGHRVPVLIEKPVADSTADGVKLVTESEVQEVPVLIGHHRRYNPLIRAAHKVIKDGELGEIRAVQATCWFYKPDSYFQTASWRKSKGGGPISINLAHDADLLRYLCGEVVEIQAQSLPSTRGHETEEVAAAVLRFESGAVGTITVADSIVSPWSWEHTSHEYPVYPRTSESCYLIGGSHGSLSVPDLTLWKHVDRRDWWTPIEGKRLQFEKSDPLVSQIRHFAAVIRGEESPLVSAREGLKTLQVVEAIQQAAESGRRIAIGKERQVN